jgi:hypothetical protein
MRSPTAKAERAAAAAFAVHEHDDRRVERRHLAQVQRNRLGDAALLRFDARVGRGRVDERNHRPAELLRQLHRAQRLPVAFGLRVAEVAVDLLLGVAASTLVMADDEDRIAHVACEPGDDRMVVREPPIAADLGELREQTADVVEDRRPLRVARDEDALPGGEVPVDFRADRVDPPIEALDRSLPLGRLRHQGERLDLLQQHGDRFFELERIGRHGIPT